MGGQRASNELEKSLPNCQKRTTNKLGGVQMKKDKKVYYIVCSESEGN